MLRHRWLFGYVLAGLLVCVAAAGFVVLQKERAVARARQADIRACIADVARRDPVEMARADAARGETRFVFVHHLGFSFFESADGVLMSSERRPGSQAQCRANRAAFPLREEPFAVFRGSRFIQDARVLDADRPLTECGLAIDRYIRQYNAELARLSPSSIGRYCEAGS